MTLDQLNRHLDEIGANPSDFSIGHEADNALVLMKVFGQEAWTVSFSERGETLEFKWFSDEGQACFYFLECFQLGQN